MAATGRNFFLALSAIGGTASGFCVTDILFNVKADTEVQPDDLMSNTAKPINRNSEKFKVTVQKSEKLAERVRLEKNIPGLVVGVSVDGRNVWTRGLGVANIELDAPCHKDTVMRIASISKPITMVLVAKLLEDDKLDLDKPLRHYLSEEEFPDKLWEGKQVDITLRQLVSHFGGIRHYKKTKKNGDKANSSDEFESLEYYSRVKYPSVIDSLAMFKNDELVAKPGSMFEYTTFGWTLISAIVEKTLPNNEQFANHLVDNVCQKQFGMLSTYVDLNEPIIYNRANYYDKSSKDPKKLINVPSVDNSYKWAGGGLLSTIPDLLKFGEVMMYSYLGGKVDSSKRTRLPGYLRQDTVDKLLWTPVPGAYTSAGQKFGRWSGYGMGWGLIRNSPLACVGCAAPPFSMAAFHSGAAVGASSFLLIVPEKRMVVAVFCNLQNTVLGDLAFEVGQAFAEVIE